MWKPCRAWWQAGEGGGAESEQFAQPLQPFARLITAPRLWRCVREKESERAGEGWGMVKPCKRGAALNSACSFSCW